MSLRTKMLVWIGTPLVVIFLAMSIFVYWDASNRITDGTKREMEALAKFHAEEIVSWTAKRGCWTGWYRRGRQDSRIMRGSYRLRKSLRSGRTLLTFMLDFPIVIL